MCDYLQNKFFFYCGSSWTGSWLFHNWSFACALSLHNVSKEHSGLTLVKMMSKWDIILRLLSLVLVIVMNSLNDPSCHIDNCPLGKHRHQRTKWDFLWTTTEELRLSVQSKSVTKSCPHHTLWNIRTSHGKFS